MTGTTQYINDVEQHIVKQKHHQTIHAKQDTYEITFDTIKKKKNKPFIGHSKLRWIGTFDGRMNGVTKSLLELFIAAKNVHKLKCFLHNKIMKAKIPHQITFTVQT